MASELRVTTIANNAGSESVDTTYVVNGSNKAWVNINSGNSFNGSFNAASLTDNGVGDYITTFTNGFANNDYAVGYIGEIGRIYSQTSTTFRIGRILDNGVATDGGCHNIFAGDLA